MGTKAKIKVKAKTKAKANGDSQWKHVSPKTLELKKCEGPGRCKFKNTDDVEHFDVTDPKQAAAAQQSQRAAQERVYGNGSAVGSGRRRKNTFTDADTGDNEHKNVSPPDVFTADIVSVLSLKTQYRVAEAVVPVAADDENSSGACDEDIMNTFHEQVDEQGLSVQLRLHKSSSLISTGFLEQNGYRCLTEECSPARRRELGDDVLYRRLSSESRRAVSRT